MGNNFFPDFHLRTASSVFWWAESENHIETPPDFRNDTVKLKSIDLPMTWREKNDKLKTRPRKTKLRDTQIAISF